MRSRTDIGRSVLSQRFYHDRPEIDHEGEELPDKHAAWKEATVIAGQTLQDLDGKLQPGRG
jgi:hypothetical protein